MHRFQEWSEASVAGHIDASRSAVRVVGEDARSWLQGVLTADIEPCRDGVAAYGLALTTKGRIMADVWVLPEAEGFVLSVPASAEEALLADFDRRIVMEDVELEPVPGARVAFLIGPKAQAVPSELAGPGIVRATAPSREIVLADASRAHALDEALTVALTAAGGGLLMADEAETLRIARGEPRFGVDFGEATYPQEAGLGGRAVSFDKGCYVGQEVVCMLELRGKTKRCLVRLELETDAPRPGDAITTEGDAQAVGEITSVAPIEVAGKSLAIGMVKMALTEEGTRLAAGGKPARVTARAS